MSDTLQFLKMALYSGTFIVASERFMHCMHQLNINPHNEFYNTLFFATGLFGFAAGLELLRVTFSVVRGPRRGARRLRRVA